MRICTRCNVPKEDALFKKDKRLANGLSNHCKACHNKEARLFRERNPERTKAYWRQRRINHIEKVKEYHKRYTLKQLFGISLEVYRQKIESQENRCKICGRSEWIVDHRTNIPYNLSVDHNHASGTVRDLLCRRCNTVFGAIEENPGIAAALLEYSKRWEGK